MYFWTIFPIIKQRLSFVVASQLLSYIRVKLINGHGFVRRDGNSVQKLGLVCFSKKTSDYL